MYGWWLEAEYESGYVLREDDADHSPYTPGRNVYHAILHKMPTEVGGHGRMVRFSMVGNGKRWDVDWRGLPDNATPVYYRDMERTINQVSPEPDDPWADSGPHCLMHHFGYKYTDRDGTAVQEVRDIT